MLRGVNRPSYVPMNQRDSMIRPYRGKRPEIAASAYIDPAAVIIGDVAIGDDSSVWPCTVIRGDVNYIRIGARTNIQDASVLHVMRDEYPLILGDDETAGPLILERTEIPPNSLVVGHPGKIKRTLTPIDQAAIDEYAKRYVAYKNIYREEPVE